jgi:hypothetical protein
LLRFARNDGFLDASAAADRSRRIPSLAAPVARTRMRSRTRNGCGLRSDGVFVVEEHKTNSATPPCEKGVARGRLSQNELLLEKVWHQGCSSQNELGNILARGGVASRSHFAKRTRQRAHSRRCGMRVALRKTKSTANAQRCGMRVALAKRDRGRPRLWRCGIKVAIRKMTSAALNCNSVASWSQFAELNRQRPPFSCSRAQRHGVSGRPSSHLANTTRSCSP